MGFFANTYKNVETELNKLWDEQRGLISDRADAGARESAANSRVAASKGGFMNSPLFDNLLAKNSAIFTGKKTEALASLGAEQAAQKLSFEREKAAGILQDNTASNQFLTNLVTGAGALLGTGLKIFGGPAGMAAGTAIDMIPKTGASVDTTNFTATSNPGSRSYGSQYQFNPKP